MAEFQKTRRQLSARYYTVPLYLTALGSVAAAYWFLFAPGTATLEGLTPLLDGTHLKIDETIDLGLHLGSLVALILLGIWLLAAPWWARRETEGNSNARQKPPVQPSTPVSLASRRSPDGLHRVWFWALVLLAVIAAGVIRYPRLNHSFWNDEEVAYRKFIHGAQKVDANGDVEFSPVSWKRTWFYNITGNNHVLQSVGSRLAVELCSDEEGGDQSIHESLTRYLPLVAGLLTIFALAFLLWQSGAGLAGVLAAWLLALNPWHVRYSVEARGYSAMLLFAVLMLVFLILAKSQRSWIPWAFYGIFQLACLLCFPAALYLVAAINIGVLLMIGLQRDGVAFRRWSTVSVIGAAVFVQIMTPSLLKMLGWLEAPYEQPQAWNREYFFNLWTHLSAGIPLYDGHHPRVFGVDLESWHRLGGVRYWLIVAIVPALSIMGGLWAFMRYPLLRLPILSVLAAVLLALLHVTLKPMVFHCWYLFYLLIPFCLCLPMLPQMLWRCNRSAGLLTAMALLVCYAGLAAAPIQRQIDFPRHPIREAVETVRGESPALSIAHSRIKTIAVGPGSGQMASYDPHTVAVKDRASLSAAIDHSRQSGEPLWVYSSNDGELGNLTPDLAEVLHDTSTFEEIDYVYGVEAFWSIRIFHLRPAAATGAEAGGG